MTSIGVHSIHDRIMDAIQPALDKADRLIDELENPHHIGRHHLEYTGTFSYDARDDDLFASAATTIDNALIRAQLMRFDELELTA